MQGTAASVNLAAYLSNPQGRTITYSTVGSLPTGVTLSGSTVSYNGTAVASTVSVRFRATSGSYEADSDVTTVSIAAPPITNSDPVWLTPTNLGTITANTPFSFTLTAVDADSDPISFIVGALPGAATATPQVQSGTSRAVVVAGTGLSVGTYTFTINADDEPPLGQVFGLVASTLSTTSIGLVWTAVSNATGYTVERSFTGTGTWTLLGSVATNSYTSTGLAPGTLYFYRVRATSATQTGEYSAAASATTVALGDAEADWTIRSTLPGTVFAHDFRAETEVTQFLRLGGASLGSRNGMGTTRMSTGIPGTGGGSLNCPARSTTLAQNVSASADGAVEQWLVADASELPDLTLGPYQLLLGSSSATGEWVLLTAKSGNTLTVTRGYRDTPKAHALGARIGADPSDDWQRPLCAVAAPSNGKAVDDIGITQGHSVARPWTWTTQVHSRNSAGYWGAEKANYPTWAVNGGTVIEPFEGTECYLQFRARWSANRFAPGSNGKWFYVDAVGSGSQQIFGNFEVKVDQTPDMAVPVWRRSYGDGANSFAGATFNDPASNIELPNGDYTGCLVGDIRNRANCFVVYPEQWITFLFHLKPGFSNYLDLGASTGLANSLLMLSAAEQPEQDIVLTDATNFPDPATWGTYPVEIRGQAVETGTITEIVKVLSKTGNTLHVMRNWWRSSGTNKTFPAGTVVDYGPFNNAPYDHAASWIQDPHLCPYHDSYFSVYAAYEGESNYRTVFESPGLPFIYGNGAPGDYGVGSDALPGFCFFKPQSYLNAYIGGGSLGPPLRSDAQYTQIILSRNFIPCPQ
jgi:hypothetical protein